MNETDEVAEAIRAKYPLLWPMTAYQASYIAQQEAGDQGDTIVNLIAQALLKLNPAPAGAFTTTLFTALHACPAGCALVYDEGHELLDTDEVRYASGDCVLLELDGEDTLFPDQDILVDSGGCCPVLDAEGRQFYFTLQIARPLTAADLEKTPCVLQPPTAP